jgi:ABC-type amino acid transport system permease subunit
MKLRMLALVAALLAGAGAAWWTRRAGLGRTARIAWCLACLLLGVPALLSLMILQPRRQAVTAGQGAIYTGGFIDLPRKS